MKCKFEGQFNIIANIPASYELLVGIMDDPELEGIAKLLINGSTEWLPEIFYVVLPDILGYWKGEPTKQITFPARDFLKSTQNIYGNDWDREFNMYFKQSKNIYDALCKLGQKIVDQMKFIIEFDPNKDFEPNGVIESVFKARTGGDYRPLINTGHMLNSIKYKVIVNNGSFN